LIGTHALLAKRFQVINRAQEAGIITEQVFLTRAKMAQDFSRIEERRQAGRFITELFP
tara:strand:- start:32605 stop:32778 length:174 start_codon:yes stop_codon:yes gene_type:complete